MEQRRQMGQRASLDGTESVVRWDDFFVFSYKITPAYPYLYQREWVGRVWGRP